MELRRDDLIALIEEALLANRAFRPPRRDWARQRPGDERRARASARAIVDHLERCGVAWTKAPSVRPHG